MQKRNSACARTSPSPRGGGLARAGVGFASGAAGAVGAGAVRHTTLSRQPHSHTWRNASHRSNLTALLASESRHAGTLRLVVLDREESSSSGAVCLDGSPPAYYLRKAPIEGRNTSWIIYLQGGGWCKSAEACVKTSTTSRGTSKKFDPSIPGEGVLDASSLLNPLFSQFNVAVFAYCDGMSFAGDHAEPQTASPREGRTLKLYFRGRRILDAQIEHLKRHHGLAFAQEVLFAGGSAGGLGALVHADSLRERHFSQVRKYRALSVSGFFRMFRSSKPSPDGLTFVEHMRNGFEAHNATNSINHACARTMGSSKSWKCFFANYSLAFTTTPTFVIQSLVDSWQLLYLARAAPNPCLSFGGDQFDRCRPDQMVGIVDYAAGMLGELWRADGQYKAPEPPGHGGFIETCYEHQSATKRPHYNTVTLDGVSMQRALEAWWEDEGGANEQVRSPRRRHWHLPCTLRSRPPFQCNPSCRFGMSDLNTATSRFKE